MIKEDNVSKTRLVYLTKDENEVTILRSSLYEIDGYTTNFLELKDLLMELNKSYFINLNDFKNLKIIHEDNNKDYQFDVLLNKDKRILSLECKKSLKKQLQNLSDYKKEELYSLLYEDPFYVKQVEKVYEKFGASKEFIHYNILIDKKEEIKDLMEYLTDEKLKESQQLIYQAEIAHKNLINEILPIDSKERSVLSNYKIYRTLYQFLKGPKPIPELEKILGFVKEKENNYSAGDLEEKLGYLPDIDEVNNYPHTTKKR